MTNSELARLGKCKWRAEVDAKGPRSGPHLKDGHNVQSPPLNNHLLYQLGIDPDHGLP